MALVGTEVKSVRAGKANLKESFVYIKNCEAFVRGMHISPYEHGNRFNVDPVRARKLLLHKREINKLAKESQQDGMTLIPLSLYLNERGKVKLELAVCKGKHVHDKRDTAAKRDAMRDMERAMKNR